MSITISGTGAITGATTSYSFDKSVSIGGTFTFEDLNVDGNVDSVGVVTARSGIHVTGGSVGIGTASPETLLTVAAPGSSAQIEIKRTNTNASGAVGALNFTAMDGHSVANIFAQGDGDNEGAHLIFKTTSGAAENDPYGSGTLERLRITSAGRLGIGTDNPNSFLHVEEDSASTIFRLKRTDEPAQILSNFSSGDSALKYTVNNASSYLLGVDDSATDRFKLSFGSSDNAAFGTNDLVSVTTTGAVEVDTGYVTLSGNQIGGIQVTIADDAFATITPHRAGGGWVFLTTSGEGSFPWAAGYARAYLDWGSSPQVSATAGGGDVATNTGGPPTGTTGTDGKVTIFVGGTSGELYLENRLGGSKNFQLTFI